MNNKEIELVQLSNCFPYDQLSYNLMPGGCGTRTFSETTRQRMAKAKLGKNQEIPENICQTNVVSVFLNLDLNKMPNDVVEANSCLEIIINIQKNKINGIA